MQKRLSTLLFAVPVFAAGLALGVSSPAAASATRLCDGDAQCSVAPYTTHNYPSHSATSYWRMDPGDNCTNYVAYVESTEYGVATPSFLLGNGADWAANARSHAITVDSTPTVGSVAQWNANDYGMGVDGHVAVVEQVGPNNSYIVVSQQNISTDTNGYDWERINAGTPANQWESWPDNFIHFIDVTPPPPPPATSTTTWSVVNQSTGLITEPPRVL